MPSLYPPVPTPYDLTKISAIEFRWLLALATIGMLLSGFLVWYVCDALAQIVAIQGSLHSRMVELNETVRDRLPSAEPQKPK